MTFSGSSHRQWNLLMPPSRSLCPLSPDSRMAAFSYPYCSLLMPLSLLPHVLIAASSYPYCSFLIAGSSHKSPHGKSHGFILLAHVLPQSKSLIDRISNGFVGHLVGLSVRWSITQTSDDLLAAFVGLLDLVSQLQSIS